MGHCCSAHGIHCRRGDWWARRPGRRTTGSRSSDSSVRCVPPTPTPSPTPPTPSRSCIVGGPSHMSRRRCRPAVATRRPGHGQRPVRSSTAATISRCSSSPTPPSGAATSTGTRCSCSARTVGSSDAVVSRWFASRRRRPGLEAIELGCELADDERARALSLVGADRRPAATVALWRSVDGRGRELVASFPADGQTAYRDPVPAGASRLVYAVVVSDVNGRIVGRSRPETVAIPPERPTPDTGPPETRPVATQPPETRPPESRPSETRPPETPPTDTRPTDTRPVETRPVDTRPATVTTVATDQRPGERGGP